MSALDWQSMPFYHYLGVAGVVVIVLSVALYAVPGGRLKVPGIVLSIVGSLGAGVAAGVILMGMTGYEFKKSDAEPPIDGPPGSVQMAGGGGRGGGGGMPPGMMMPGGGGGRGGGGGPSPKAQLAGLVNKLDVLTEKPLTVHLTEEQRKQVREQLAGLADKDDLSDEAAKEKLDKLLDVLKDQKDTLRAAGYNWPGEGNAGGGRGGPPGGPPGGGRGGQQPPANPFKTEQNAEHLKHLTERLDKSPA